ncbi:4070_t:CDS:2 [Funneliformis caledonium]|uniref:4070_t:CDS:1 n=1 Tax=Funneliformis caledonium TaxID=1117310 RepID=A0A9N9AVE1_9GLOM|nr:4070_t:CDS:2 [Funneliformis caledonium]
MPPVYYSKAKNRHLWVTARNVRATQQIMKHNCRSIMSCEFN